MDSPPAPFPIPPMVPEGVVGVPLPPPIAGAPKRLVLVRLQAFGDTIALLPVLAGIKRRFPTCLLEVVTAPSSASLFAAHADVSAVHLLEPRKTRLARAWDLVRLSRDLTDRRPDAILDFQRSGVTRRLVAWSRARAWVAQDRFAPRNGLTRHLEAVEFLGLGPITPVFEPRVRPDVVARGRELLASAGREPSRPLVCLNPAGGWETKRWPLERWTELGKRLREDGAQLLLVGEGAHLPRFAALAETLAPELLDLSGRTTPDVAMALMAETSLMVSEDSGLMHLAWTQGVPTVALFGATRSAWSAPIAPGCSGFYSEDLACGACMQPTCARGDLLCLMRVEVSEVLGRARAALQGRGVSLNTS